jgi:hypothetical protein
MQERSWEGTSANLYDTTLRVVVTEEGGQGIVEF